jgi:RNA polymerase sigma factor (sigma-70 family)
MAEQRVIQAVRTYGKQLFSFIRGRVPTDEDAEDILQDVWYQLSNQPEVEAIESVSGWLFRVARNRITDLFRKKKPEALEDFGYENEEGEWLLKEILLADDFNPEAEDIRQIFWEELMAALEELPEKQREVFILNELEDRTLQEIADSKGENLKTIISRKGYAVKHLRSRLENLYQELFD